MDMLSYSSLSAALADERERAIREKARDAWRRQQSGRLKLRNATFADAADLHRLARLDSQPYPPSGRLVVAVEDGAMIAAVAVESGDAIADPFRSTAAGRRAAAAASQGDARVGAAAAPDLRPVRARARRGRLSCRRLRALGASDLHDPARRT